MDDVDVCVSVEASVFVFLSGPPRTDDRISGMIPASEEEGFGVAAFFVEDGVSLVDDSLVEDDSLAFVELSFVEVSLVDFPPSNPDTTSGTNPALSLP